MMSEKEIKKAFNDAYEKYLKPIKKGEELANMAIISKFELLFFKKIKEVIKEKKERGKINGN